MAESLYYNSPLVNSDKCVVSTRDAVHGDVCYVLRRPIVNNGAAVVIESHYSNSTNKLTKGAIIYPSLMFRMPLADQATFNNLFFIDQPQVNSNLLWNPGLAVNSVGKFNLPDTQTYYEFNLSRFQLQQLIGKTFVLTKKEGYQVVVNTTDIKAWALDPKILVEHDGATDYITISYSARVDIKGTYKIKSPSNIILKSGNLNTYWTTPYVIKFPVTRSSIKTLSQIDVNNFTWSYGFDTTKVADNIKSLNNLGVAIGTASYDFSVIPMVSMAENVSLLQGRTYHTYEMKYYWPVSFGCKLDMVIDYQASITYTVLSYGLFRSTKYRTDIVVSSFVMGTTPGYVDSITSSMMDLGIPTYPFQPCSKVSICKNGSVLLVAAQIALNTQTSTLENAVIKSFDTGAGLMQTSPYWIFNQVDNIQLFKCGAGFGMCVNDLVSGGRLYVLSLPNSISGNYMYSITNNFIPPGATILVSASKTLRKELYKYSGLGSSDIYYLNPLNNSEIFYNIDFNLNRSRAPIARYIGGDNLIIDNPENLALCISRSVYVPTTNVINFDSTSRSLLYSLYEDENKCFIVVLKANEANVVTDYVMDYNMPSLDISNATIQPEYWANPEFATSEANGVNSGVKLIVSLINCLGLYTAGPISGGDAWDPSARPCVVYPGGVSNGGIPLDLTRTRTDMNYTYNGTQQGYQDQQPPTGTNSKGETRFGGSYTLSLDSGAVVQLKYKGRNIIAGADAQGNKKIIPICWKYNETGSFNMYLDLSLALDGVTGDDNESTFTSAGFTMSNCLLSVDLKNITGSTISKFVDKAFTISPPSPTGYIDFPSYKVMNDITFHLYRETDPASLNFTTIRNLEFKFYQNAFASRYTFKPPITNYTNTKNDGAINDVYIPFGAAVLNRGDYVQLRYEPRIKDSRAYPGTVMETPKVTCVKDHKYSISDVTFEFEGDSGWEDVTTKITTESVIHYSDITSLNMRTTFAIDHEVWADRSELSDDRVYPYISGVYMVVLPILSHLPATRSTDDSVSIDLKARPPIGTAVTYPNHTKAFADMFYNNFVEAMLVIDSNRVHKLYNTDPTITSVLPGTYTLQCTLSSPGTYQVYVVIEDQFTQKSCFCLTNSKANYNIPFRS